MESVHSDARSAATAQPHSFEDGLTSGGRGGTMGVDSASNELFCRSVRFAASRSVPHGTYVLMVIAHSCDALRRDA